MAGRFSVQAVFKGIDAITAPVTKMQNRISKFTRKAKAGFRSLNRVASKFGQTLRNIGTKGVVAFAAMGFVIKDLIVTGADFGRAIGSAAAKFPEQIQRGTDAFKELEETARKVGSTTEFTSTQAAQGLNFLAKAGFSAKDAMAALPSIIDFATASEIEFAEAADVASDTIGAFELGIGGMQRVMDVMSKTANSSNVTIAELFESIKGGGAIFTTAGSDIESFSAIMGFLANSSIKGAKAGIAAKNITLALAGVGNKAAATFKKLGINLADSNGDLRDQFDVLDELREKLKPLGTKQKVSIIQAIFGKIPIAAASKLLAESGKSVREFREELQKAGGTSKRVAAFIRNDVKGSIDSLKSAIEGVKLSIFELNEGPLKDMIDRWTDWLRVNEKMLATKIGEFLLKIINNIEKIKDTVVFVAKAVAIFIVFSTVLKTLAAALIVVNFLMALNPLALMVIAAVALVAGFIALVTWVDEISEKLGKMPAIIKFIITPWRKFLDLIKLVKKGIGGVFAFGGKIVDFFGGGKDDNENGAAGGANLPPIEGVNERVLRQVDEKIQTTKNQVEITTGEGLAARIVGNALASGLTLTESGAF